MTAQFSWLCVRIFAWTWTTQFLSFKGNSKRCWNDRVCVCVCTHVYACMCMCTCMCMYIVCICVWERERECVYVYVCVCVCAAMMNLMNSASLIKFCTVCLPGPLSYLIKWTVCLRRKLLKSLHPNRRQLRMWDPDIVALKQQALIAEVYSESQFLPFLWWT